MKLVALCGSPRKEGNTEICLQTVLEAAAAEGVETELIRLCDRTIAGGCRACGACGETKDGTCAAHADDFNELVKKVYAADALVAGSPVYFGSATPELMAFMHRMGYVARRMPESPLAKKIAAGVAVARRAGQNFTLDQIQNVFGPLDVTLAGSSYWSIAFGGAAGSVREDEEGLRTMTTLGQNLARLIHQAKK